METLQIGCVMIERNGKFLIAQRSPGMSYAGWWEFPGGKLEECETIEQCLVREIQEELGILIQPTEFLCRKDFEYPTRKVSLVFYFCQWVSGQPSRKDCFDFAWVTPREMKNYQFLPADIEVIDYLMKTNRTFRK
ncbi:MAG: 8-oxo-dGTP diphosphatase MutT [Candidatus Omnitrophica bacterium]|nr:8-oxo-dGTP diphosphatase MutT [Candidatus Omnitrophota bacterium]